MIIRFNEDLANTNWKTRFEGKDSKGKIAMIRLAYGTDEVVEKLQDQNANQKEFKTGPVNKNVDGKLYYETEIDDPAVIKFLQATPYWKDGRVAEFDPLADNKKKEEMLIRDTEILGKVAAISDNTDLVKYGYYLFGNSALDKAATEDYAGLRVELFLYAQENPEDMIALMDEKNSKSAENLEAGLAFVKGIIKEADSGNSVVWGDTDVKILTVVIGQTPLEATVEFFGTSEGKEVKQLVGQKMMEIVKENAAKSTPSTKDKGTATKETGK